MDRDDEGMLMVEADGSSLAADDGLLALLGASSMEDVRRAQAEAFAGLRARWVQRDGGPPRPHAAELPATGEGPFAVIADCILRRVDGRLLRVRAALAPPRDGREVVLMCVLDDATEVRQPRICRIHDVLAEWRITERRLREAVAGSEEAVDLVRQSRFLRDLYQLLFERSSDREP